MFHDPDPADTAKRMSFIVRSSDVGRCPIKSLLATHYREDGSCKCDEQSGDEPERKP